MRRCSSFGKLLRTPIALYCLLILINLCSRDLQRATTILEMVRRREETKRDHLKMTVNIFEKRVEIRDFNGAVYSELNAQYKNSRCV